MRARHSIFAIFIASCVSPQSAQVPADGIHVGALLPFSGEQAASGANIEHALILASEHINTAGGVEGEPIRVETLDTHSEPTRGLTAARSLLIDRNLGVVIGPEENGLAQDMTPLVQMNDALLVMPGVTAPAVIDFGAGGWVRLSASSTVVGCALALRMHDDGVVRGSAMVGADDYSINVADAFSRGFLYLGGQGLASVPLSDDESTHTQAIQTMQRLQPDGALLLTTPATAATIVQEWATLGASEQPWYFSPTLEADAFPRNVPPGSIEGHIGASPALPDDRHFADVFSARWTGDTPLSSAYRYYDALVLVALAWNAALQAMPGVEPSQATLRDQIIRISGPPGEQVSWEQLGHAIELVRAGTDINYEGASGALDLDTRGDVRAQAAVMRYWQIEGDHITNTGVRITCPDDVYSAIANGG